MCYFREASLYAAASTPLFSRPGRQVTIREKYPFVFDNYAEAKQSSAFVAGAKVITSKTLGLFHLRLWGEGIDMIVYLKPTWGFHTNMEITKLKLAKNAVLLKSNECKFKTSYNWIKSTAMCLKVRISFASLYTFGKAIMCIYSFI